jgi:nitrite reductase (cytochrome c-552)
MPKIERNGKTVTDHTLNSPLNKLDNCRRCHNGISEEQLYQWVYTIQVRNVAALIRAEKAVLALIEDIATVRQALAERDPFAAIADDADREAAITDELAEVLNFHRRSSMRWDYIGASNSSGAHSPAEALRVLEQAVLLAQDGQALLKAVAARHGIDLVPTAEPTLPAAPAVLEPGNIVGSPPPAITLEADRATRIRLSR